MADIEKNRFPPRTTSTSFTRMLELEKKYKLERLQNSHCQLAHPSSPSAAPPVSPQPNWTPSIQARRADSLQRQQQQQQHQNEQMLKAVRRSIALPSLSISIPQGNGDRQREGSRDGKSEKAKGKETEKQPAIEADVQLGKPVTIEPVQKQVKFLAPDDDEDEEEEEEQKGDDASDQSSICQSPSWSGYGQKQKEKKQEAERKKKEKEQANKEAKAARRKMAARLSKAPPNVNRSSSTIAFSFAAHDERSMSDSILTTRGLLPTLQPSPALADVENDLAEVHSELNAAFSSSPRGFAFGVESTGKPSASGRQSRPSGLAQEHVRQRPSTSSSQYPLDIAGNSVDLRPRPRKSQSVGPGSSAPPPTVRDHRTPRESCPPSASRTPLLKAQAQAAQAPTRSNSFLQNASKIFRGRDSRSQGSTSDYQNSNTSQESIHAFGAGKERGRSRDGYVRGHRDQSTERAMAGLVDDQVSAMAMSTKHARRPSLTQEAKSVAMRLAGIKSALSKSDKSEKGHARAASSVDYIKFLTEPYMPPGLELMSLSHASSLPPSLRKPDFQRPAPPEPDPAPSLAQETGQPVSNSSKDPSIEEPATSSEKVKGTKNTGKADSGANKDLASTSATSKPSKSMVSAPPYFFLRARLTSHGSSSTKTKSGSAEEQAPVEPKQTVATATKSARGDGTPDSGAVPTTATTHPLTSQPIKTTTVQTQPGSRVSEGSSSSSAYDDGSPLPSPATTPDTSRPQSAGGMPPVLSVPKGTAESLMVQDDERTLRQSVEVGLGSESSSTPRVEVAESRERMMDDERWSRTALPLEIDFDAQSFVTSLTNLDHVDSIDREMSKASLIPKPLTSPHATVAPRPNRENISHDAFETRDPARAARHRPRLSKSISNPDMRTRSQAAAVAASFSPMASRDILIPARSPKRERHVDQPPTPTTPTTPTNDGNMSRPKDGKLVRRSEVRELKGQSSYERFKSRVSANSAVPPSDVSRDVDPEKSAARPAGSDEKVPGRWRRSDESSDRDSAKEATRRQQQNAQAEAEQAADQQYRQESTPENGSDSEPIEISPASLKRSATGSSIASTSSSSLLSSRFMSPVGGFVPTAGFSSNPYFVDFDKKQSSAESTDTESFRDRAAAIASPSPTPDARPSFTKASSHTSLPPQPKSSPQAQPARPASSLPPLRSAPTSTPAPVHPIAPSPSPAPSGRGMAVAPVSILKQSTRSPSPPPLQQQHALRENGQGQSARSSQPVLSALPKHMQMQAGVSVRPPSTMSEFRQAPLAKMLVECCSCKFFHDMPSKVYECMAKPDAVVEDRALGVSGAITTRVKCPWCHHDMSTQCCAGYAAVVYLKEKLH